VLSIPGLVTNRSVTAGIDIPEATDEQPAPAPEGAPATPEGAVPAGQITIGEDGQLKTDAPAGEQKSEAAPESKPEAAPEADKKAAEDQKKQ
jgi:hypothetical protein